jgi:hypothetical protein
VGFGFKVLLPSDDYEHAPRQRAARLSLMAIAPRLDSREAFR